MSVKEKNKVKAVVSTDSGAGVSSFSGVMKLLALDADEVAKKRSKRKKASSNSKR